MAIPTPAKITLIVIPAVVLAGAVWWFKASTDLSGSAVTDVQVLDWKVLDALSEGDADHVNKMIADFPDAPAQIIRRAGEYLPGAQVDTVSFNQQVVDLEALARFRLLALNEPTGMPGPIRAALQAHAEDVARLDAKAYRMLGGVITGNAVAMAIPTREMAALVTNLAMTPKRQEQDVLGLMAKVYRQLDLSPDAAQTLHSELLRGIWIRSALDLPVSDRQVMLSRAASLSSEADLARLLAEESDEVVRHAALVTAQVLPDALFEVVRAQIIKRRNDQSVVALLDTFTRYGIRARSAKPQITTLYQLSENATIKAKLRETLEKLSGRSV